jgi:hypothetical protein
MSIGVGPKIYLHGAKPNTHTWWLRPPTLFLRYWLHFGVSLIYLHFSWEIAYICPFDDFEFCKHEQIVPLSASLYPKPSYLRKTKKTFQISIKAQNSLLIKGFS